MAYNPFNTKNRQSTQSLENQASTASQQYVDIARTTLGSVGDMSQDITRIYREGRKIALSEAGIFRYRTEAPAGVKTNKEGPAVVGGAQTKANYTVNDGFYSPESEERKQSAQNSPNDPILDGVLVCGNYYLPLNIDFQLRKQKKMAESQLVDGINIIERVYKGPAQINVRFDLERRQESQTGRPDPLVLRNRTGNGDPTPIYRLRGFFQELYDNDEVFQIENKVLNDEYGISWVVMANFDIAPQRGSTLIRISMLLQEVNITDPLLYTNTENKQQYGQIPTQKK